MHTPAPGAIGHTQASVHCPFENAYKMLSLLFFLFYFISFWFYSIETKVIYSAFAKLMFIVAIKFTFVLILKLSRLAGFYSHPAPGVSLLISLFEIQCAINFNWAHDFCRSGSFKLIRIWPISHEREGSAISL